MAELWLAWPDEQCLATDVRIARSFYERTLGVIPDQPLDDGYGLAFEYDDVGRRGVHMLGVREPLEVVWLQDTVVVDLERLRPWVGRHAAQADTVVELPVGGAESLLDGHRVELRAREATS